MDINNRQILLKKRPEGMINENDLELIDNNIENVPDNHVLIKTMYISIDPYLRGRMTDQKSYIKPFNIGDVIKSRVIGEVIHSNSEKFKAGEVVIGLLDWADYSVEHENNLELIYNNIDPVTASLHTVGMPGLTAYFGLEKIGKPKKGDTIVISGAGGAVGMIAGQLAKLKGCRVVGITGSDTKANYLLNNLKFDNVLNYKTSKNLKKDLTETCPEGIDIYFDNVGGYITDIVCFQLNFHARVILCGQISQYNNQEIEYGPRVFQHFLTRSIKLGGFILKDYKEEFETGKSELIKFLNEGKLLQYEHIKQGLEQAPAALIGLFEGENLGKMLVKID